MRQPPALWPGTLFAVFAILSVIQNGVHCDFSFADKCDFLRGACEPKGGEIVNKNIKPGLVLTLNFFLIF